MRTECKAVRDFLGVEELAEAGPDASCRVLEFPVLIVDSEAERRDRAPTRLTSSLGKRSADRSAR